MPVLERLIQTRAEEKFSRGKAGSRLIDEPLHFEEIDEVKPFLFPPQSQVIQKTGSKKNLITVSLFSLILLFTALFFPYSPSFDRHAVVMPASKIHFTSPLAGIIRGVRFKQGDSVKKGELIALIESPELMQRLDELHFNARILKKEILKAQGEISLLDLQTEEISKLQKMGSIDRNAIEQLAIQKQIKKEQLDSLNLQFERVLSESTGIKKQISDSEIRAPFDGFIVSLIESKKETHIEPGHPLVTVAGSKLQLRTKIPEKDFWQIDLKQPVKIRFPFELNQDYYGQITHYQFSDEMNSASKDRMVVMFADLNNAPAGIQSGMSVKISLPAKKTHNLRRLYHEFI